MKLLRGIEIILLTVVILFCLVTLTIEIICQLLGGSFGWFIIPVCILGIITMGKLYLDTQTQPQGVN